ncbi:MAG: hypothetical protein M3019_08790 [Candidatus Dormibacteraeota bacterium]|nr:hypothetical protein [Candidatus Dormibacteraeota bacterium]
MQQADPPARADTAMAYDVATGTVVMFGGLSGSQALDDTWTWSGASWHQEHPLSSPPPLVGPAMAYDPVTRGVLLFGGPSDGIIYANAIAADSAAKMTTGQTWLWDGANWHQMPGPQPPAPFFTHSVSSFEYPPAWMATDPATRTILLVSSVAVGPPPQGYGCGGTAEPACAQTSDDSLTYRWNGGGWTEIGKGPVVSIGTVMFAGLDVDPASGKLWIVGIQRGGLRSTPTAVNDWNGSAWDAQRRLEVPGPGWASFRYETAAASDVVTEQAVGGTVQTWLYDGSAWHQMAATAHTPTFPYGVTMVDDVREGKIVAFGGWSSTGVPDAWAYWNVTWIWDRSGWTQYGAAPSSGA